MVKSGTLFLVAIAFGAGFLFGFSYHHIVDEHHEQTREHTVTHAARPGPTDTQWQRFEARLAALEKREKQVTAAVPTAQAPEVQHHAEAPAGGGRNGHAKLPALKLPVLGAATSAPAGCKGKRKPYHIVLTAQDSPYQAWQTRIMYYHFKKLQKANPCTEMTGFTRMLNSDGARRDGLMDEMPTTLVHALDRGSGCHDSDQNTCDMGFPVMNRPHGVTQLLAQLDRGEHHIEEEYVLIAETDHVFMKEPKNRATPKMPACFPFGYMNAQAEPLRGVVQRFVSANPKDVDPCGPSPVLIHLPQLRKLTPEWLSMSFALKRDAEADKHFGWVLEMWGYTLAATKLGIRHFVWRDLQTEPSALWHSDLDGEPHIYHYTFGLEYTSDGMPVTGGVGDWSLDKRHFMNEYPPPDMAAPPRCAGKAAHRLHAMFNEAIAGTPQWPAKHAARGTVGWGPGAAAGLHAVDDEMYHQQPAVQRLVTQGPWKLGGKGPILFFRLGRMHTPWGSGTWGLEKARGRHGHGRVVMQIGSCGAWSVELTESGASFVATNKKTAKTLMGEIAEGGATFDAAAEPGGKITRATEMEGGAGAGGDAVRRLLGSGPWAWTGVSSVGWLRGGVLHTPWGMGTWRAHEAGDGRIVATFVGEEHHVTVAECASFVSRRKRDGDRATGAMSLSPAATTCPELE